MFKIFSKLGGEEAALAVLARRRGRPQPFGFYAVRSWRLAGSMPAINILHFKAECEARGIPFDFSDCEWQSDPKPLARSGTRQGVCPAPAGSSR